MSKSPPANAQEPIFDAAALSAQTHGLIAASTEWLREHWLQILIAFAIGTVIVLALHAVRRIGAKLCDRPHWAAGWGVVLAAPCRAPAISSSSCSPPSWSSAMPARRPRSKARSTSVHHRRRLPGGALGARADPGIDRAPHSRQLPGRGLLSAMGLIRLLVTFALFAIALVVVLDNLGVNVTGLVAAWASAASPSAWRRRASSPTCSRRWRSSSTGPSAGATRSITTRPAA